MFRGVLLLAIPAVALCANGCTTPKTTRPYQEPPPASVKPTVIAYADTDAFDSLLESALLNREPAILIQTASQKPDWSGRLNAWIAAWNMGGAVAAEEPQRRVRMQAPLPTVVVDGDSIREFRLLIDDLMGRVNFLAAEGSSWWKIDKMQKTRVALLKPYNLRFHIDSAKNIQIILFNGQYPAEHRAFVQSIAHPDDRNAEDWARGYSCSQCPQVAHASSDSNRIK